MKFEEIEIGQEVVCTALRGGRELEPRTKDLNEENRVVGHIGTVTGLYPLKDLVLVSHIERSDKHYVELLTWFHIDELSPYEPLEKPLQRAIQNTLTQITR